MRNNENLRIEKREIVMVDFIDYEKWLESMELEGWNLKSIDLNNEHTFVKGKPRKIRYCLDYREENIKEYARMFTDFGWKLIYLNDTDFVWAKEYEGERPEAFDTLEALKEKNAQYKKDITIKTGGLLSSLIMFVYVYGDKMGAIIAILWTIGFMLIQVLCNLKKYKFLNVYNKNKKLIEELTR